MLRESLGLTALEASILSGCVGCWLVELVEADVLSNGDVKAQP